MDILDFGNGTSLWQKCGLSVSHRLLNGGHRIRVQVVCIGSRPFWYYTIPKIDTLSITLDAQTQQQLLCVTEPMLLLQVVSECSVASSGGGSRSGHAITERCVALLTSWRHARRGRSSRGHPMRGESRRGHPWGRHAPPHHRGRHSRRHPASCGQGMWKQMTHQRQQINL